MLNFIKYKKEILNYAKKHGGNLEGSMRYIFNCYDGNCKNGTQTEAVMQWLCEDDGIRYFGERDREYLQLVIRPFRNVIGCVRKQSDGVHLCTFEGDIIFPYFLNEMMFKKIEENKDYSLEELGL